MRRLAYHYLCLLARHEWPFRLYYRFHGRYASLLTSRDTDLVIEGFPRCGNTFAVVAFQRAQSRPLRIAHHLHAQVQVKMAIAWRIPTLIVIRDPVGAVASLITRQPEVSISQALAQYQRFYSYVYDCRPNVVVAEFHDVTTAFARVIQRLNAHFGSAFQAYVNSEEEDAKVFEAIDALNRDEEGASARTSARPLPARNELLQAASRKVATHPMLRQAIDLYRRLIG